MTEAERQAKVAALKLEAHTLNARMSVLNGEISWPEANTAAYGLAFSGNDLAAASLARLQMIRAELELLEAVH